MFRLVSCDPWPARHRTFLAVWHSAEEGVQPHTQGRERASAAEPRLPSLILKCVHELSRHMRTRLNSKVATYIV